MKRCIAMKKLQRSQKRLLFKTFLHWPQIENDFKLLLFLQVHRELEWACTLKLRVEARHVQHTGFKLFLKLQLDFSTVSMIVRQAQLLRHNYCFNSLFCKIWGSSKFFNVSFSRMFSYGLSSSLVLIKTNTKFPMQKSLTRDPN